MTKNIIFIIAALCSLQARADVQPTERYTVHRTYRYDDTEPVSYTHLSPDGASSVVEAIQTFKQKSIRTVYNLSLIHISAEVETDARLAFVGHG